MSDSRHSHFPPRTLRAYRDGQTDPAETLAISDGLADCAACRATLAGLDHGPAYEELAAAAAGTLDLQARAALSARLADDPAAAAELANLEAFRREMGIRPEQTYNPPDRPLATDPAPGKIVPLVAWWRARPLAALAAAAALLAVCAAGWWTLTPPGANDDSRLLTGRDGRPANLAALPADLRMAVDHALRDGQLEVPPVLGTLRPASGMLAGSADEAGFHVLAPVGVVTRDLQPTLRWTPRDGATGYEITLVRDEGEDPSYGGDPRRATTEWTPSHPLTPGATYSWQVRALRGEETLDRAPKPPAAEARFQVLSDAPRAELARLEADYARFPLVVAAALARAGLTDEASVWADRLAREHPQSLLAQRLREHSREAAQRPSPIRTNGAQ